MRFGTFVRLAVPVLALIIYSAGCTKKSSKKKGATDTDYNQYGYPDPNANYNQYGVGQQTGDVLQPNVCVAVTDASGRMDNQWRYVVNGGTRAMAMGMNNNAMNPNPYGPNYNNNYGNNPVNYGNQVGMQTGGACQTICGPNWIMPTRELAMNYPQGFNSYQNPGGGVMRISSNLMYTSTDDGQQNGMNYNGNYNSTSGFAYYFDIVSRRQTRNSVSTPGATICRRR